MLSAEEVALQIELQQGNEQPRAWVCDLTYDHVKINGDYRS